MMFKKQDGFTLIEMLIVLAVITLLLVLVVPNLATQNHDIQNKGEQALIQMAENQTQVYYIDHGRHPSSIKQLDNEGYLSTDEVANGQKKLIYVDGDPTKIAIVENEE